MKTKTCRHCKEVIAKKAKRCPKCGGKLGIPGYAKALIIIVIIIGLIAGCANSISDALNDDKKALENIKCTTEKQYLEKSGIGYYIEGSCVNNNEKDYSYLQVEYICYDKSGNNLGTALDNTNNLLANQTWKFKAISMTGEDKQIDHCEFHEVTGW